MSPESGGNAISKFRERRIPHADDFGYVQSYLAKRISPENLPLVFSLSPREQGYLYRLWWSYEKGYELDPEPDVSPPDSILDDV